MRVTLHSACVGKLNCGLTAKHQKYIQDAVGQEGLIAKVFCMARTQHCEGKASTACQSSMSLSHQGNLSTSVRGSSSQVIVNTPSEAETQALRDFIYCKCAVMQNLKKLIQELFSLLH